MTADSKEVLADVTARIRRLPVGEIHDHLALQLGHLRETYAWLLLARAGRTSPPSVAIVFGMALGMFVEAVVDAEQLAARDSAARS